MMKTKKTLITLMFIFLLLSLITCGNDKAQKINTTPLTVNLEKKEKKTIKKRKKSYNSKRKIKPLIIKNKLDKLTNDNEELFNNEEITNNNELLINNEETINNNESLINNEEIINDNKQLANNEEANHNNEHLLPLVNQQNEIIKYEPLNKDDEYLTKYNSLVNYDERYQKQLTNCQTLINELTLLINKTNDNELINHYQHLIRRTNHKRKWLINNHLGYGYWFISIIQLTISLVILLKNSIDYYFDHQHKPYWQKINELFKITTLLNKNHKLYRFLYSKTIFLYHKTNFNISFFPLICFLLMFIFNNISNFDDHLANNIHYLFTKYSFKNNYSLPKHQVCYFYYDHSTKMIVNNKKYFTVPFLFTNNNHLITNMIDLTTNLFTLTVIGWSIIRKYRYQKNNYYQKPLICNVLLAAVLTKVLSWFNMILIHLLSENNIINKIKLTITSFFKACPFINMFYYVPGHGLLAKLLTNIAYQIPAVKKKNYQTKSTLTSKLISNQ